MSDRASGQNPAASGSRMPANVRGAVFFLVAAAFAGGLYLIAVRGDVLLSDLSAAIALICG